MATITELADSLVRDENISFRQAHEVSQQLSKELISKNISLYDVEFTIFSKLFEKLVGAPLKMNEKRFKEVCSPEYFIKIRNLPGGPSKQSITNSLEIYKKDLSEYKNIIVKCENSIDESKNKLINFYKNHS